MGFVTRIAGAAALGAPMLAGAGVFAPPARAGYIVTLTQVGSNVVATGRGTINLTGLIPVGGAITGAGIYPNEGFIATGSASFTPVDLYFGFAGPTNFGSGGNTNASRGSGDTVAIDYNTPGYAPNIEVPHGYVSGSPLKDSAIYDNATFASLGVIPGTYVWTWGSGVTRDSFTLNVGPRAIPEPSGLLLLALPLGLLALLATRRCRAARNAGSG